MNLTLYQSGRLLSPYISNQEDYVHTNRLYYIYGGTGGILINGKQFSFKKDHLYLIPHTIKFMAFQNSLDPLDHLYFDFAISPVFNHREVLELPIEENSILSHMLDTICAIAFKKRAKHNNYNQIMQTSLKTLLFMIDELHPILTPAGNRFETTIQYMLDHYAEDISITELAHIAHMEEHYFIRLFKEHFHTTPYQYLRDYRLNTAVEMLKNGFSIVKTAQNVGYGTASALSHALKKSKGFYPSDIQNPSITTLTDSVITSKHPHSYWIWLNPDFYPDFQNTYCTIFADKELHKFCVAEFKKTYQFHKKIQHARLYVSGDTRFRLWANNHFIGSGPIPPGGDYGNTLPMPKHYCSYYDLSISGNTLEFFAQVQLSPEVMTDYSRGHGGFWLALDIEYSDKTTESFGTDESWFVRYNSAYASARYVDYRITPDAWHNAVSVNNIWHLILADIPMLTENHILPANNPEITIPANTQLEANFEFDKIYSGYIVLDIKAKEACKIEAELYESPLSYPEYPISETIITDTPTYYRSMRKHSIGGCKLKLQNSGNSIVRISVSLISSHYPVSTSGRFVCSDSLLNQIFDLGKWTLQICRQDMHLESPYRQQVPGNTGGYLIENLIDYYILGDTRLAALDILRIADYLRMTDGFMFHTSAGLIWIQMLYDYYNFTGNKKLIKDTLDTVHILLKQMLSYSNRDGIIYAPPNYMFIDWASVDEYTMHHPPKALGQTCLNAFYYKALTDATVLCEICHDENAKIYAVRAEKLKRSFQQLFWNSDRKLYFDGTISPDTATRWKPENPGKYYYSQHSNALAVLYGLCPEEYQLSLMEKVMTDKTLTHAQPYFMHYILEALYKVGLFAKYGLNQIRAWNVMLQECDKGWKEGWDGHKGDYSHGWSATPTYQLTSKLLGFQMLEPGFKKIALRPALYGLSYAEIEMPTPYGMITCKIKEGHVAEITCPEKIKYELLEN